MAANANFTVAIEIHSHHNEFKMRLPVELLNSNRAFQKKKKVIETPNNLWQDHVERGSHEKFIFNMFVFFLRPGCLEPILYIITNKGNISERTI